MNNTDTPSLKEMQHWLLQLHTTAQNNKNSRMDHMIDDITAMIQAGLSTEIETVQTTTIGQKHRELIGIQHHNILSQAMLGWSILPILIESISQFYPFPIWVDIFQEFWNNSKRIWSNHGTQYDCIEKKYYFTLENQQYSIWLKQLNHTNNTDIITDTSLVELLIHTICDWNKNMESLLNTEFSSTQYRVPKISNNNTVEVQELEEYINKDLENNLFETPYTLKYAWLAWNHTPTLQDIQTPSPIKSIPIIVNEVALFYVYFWLESEQKSDDAAFFYNYRLKHIHEKVSSLVFQKYKEKIFQIFDQHIEDIIKQDINYVSVLSMLHTINDGFKSLWKIYPFPMIQFREKVEEENNSNYRFRNLLYMLQPFDVMIISSNINECDLNILHELELLIRTFETDIMRKKSSHS